MRKCAVGTCCMLLVLVVFTFTVSAEVRLPALFSPNMVLQRGMEVPVWGWADTGEMITVRMAGEERTVRTSSDGTWSIKLSQLPVGGPYEMVIEGTNTITLGNILVGEVWICSGQSNMEMKVAHTKDGRMEIANGYYPEIRLFDVSNDMAAEPQSDCRGTWTLCRPQKLYDFSGTAYYFGRKIHQELGVPVGLIHSSWGGSSSETWTSMETVKTDPTFRPILEHWKPVLNNPSSIVEYYRAMSTWIDDIYYVMNTGVDYPKYADPPDLEVNVSLFPEIPSLTYNAMLAPIIPYAVRGAIWYQGETNAGRAYQYRDIFPGLIKDWRAQWGQGDFPFLFVQLANFREHDDQPVESDWAELREAQLMTLSLPNTAMAVAIDIGEAKDIHPKNKQEVGRRLALGALKVAYGQDIVYSGPLYDSMSLENSRIRIRFTNSGSGLVTKDNIPLSGFAVAGEDRKFVWADAEIDGDEVVVWSDSIAAPAAVRYGWANNPDCNLYNKEGLPASPFRTDDWPGITAVIEK